MHAIFRKMLIALAATLALPLAAQATPLTLNYSIMGGTTYTYDFTLVLDNHDASWAAGQDFNWIIFGDSRASSPLTNFVGDPAALPIGPFTTYQSSSGGHNGPSLLSLSGGTVDGWVPTAVGSALHWKGTSTAYLGQGQLLWSNLIGNNGATPANFEAGMLVPVPEPETYGMLLAGLVLLGVAARRKSAAKE